MDVTPIIPAGRQVIEAYGSGLFRVSGVAHRNSILVFPDATLAWPVVDAGALTMDSFEPVIVRGGIEVLLLGCGARMALIPKALKQKLRDAGIVLDAMDTGAACRTYNVLLSEERRVAAALIALA